MRPRMLASSVAMLLWVFVRLCIFVCDTVCVCVTVNVKV
jgi:hypothetical protein